VVTVDSPVIVTLDVATAEEALRLARLLAPSVGGFKIGLELLMGPGAVTISAVASLDRPVLVDAKLHDIPTTTHRAADQLGRLGARWVTVHALGGRAMLEAAVEGLRARNADGGILAVTVLTSMPDDDLTEVGLRSGTGKQTARLARLASAAGCEGVICPGPELGVVAQVAPELLRVVPGIRPTGSPIGDQALVTTPGEAIGRGADLIVVGRPVTRAPDPREAAEQIAEEVRRAKGG
jgi:orotidine-5'-phosphate decarboxylase